MADDGFEQFHVPQQSRRDKLRVVTAAAAQSHNQQHQSNCQDVVTALPLHGCTGLLPLYDPSLLSQDILTCSNTLGTLKQQNPVCVKEEGNGNFMSFVSGYMTMNTTSASSSSSSHYHHQQHHHHPYLDPLSTSSNPSNPSSIQDITNNNNSSNNNNNPFLYTVQNLRDYEQSFHGGGGGDVVGFKPQGLAITDESRTTRTSTGQGLSLSLSSHHTHHPNHNHNHNLPLELNLPSSLGYGVRGIIDGGGASTSNNNDVRNSVPLGPFTGYASILKGSKFLKPAKQLLDELCDVGRGIYVDRSSGDSSSLMDPSMDILTVDDHVMTNDQGGGGEHRRKKSRLISMLDEVYRRYKLYYQQMQAIVASFESVAGLGDAAPYTSFALKAMSKHFSCLKNAITDQLHFTNKAIVEGSHSKDESQRFGNGDRWSHGQRPPAHHLSYFEHHNQPVWRPQRGLPERAVAVLRAWLFEHFLHPYPTDTDKQMLAKQTGLSRSQVSNWFINARVRLWKPMVEEIHMLETRQTQKTSDVEDRNSSKSDDPLPTSNQLNSDKQPQTSSTLNIQDQTPKRSRVEVVHVPDKAIEPGNFMYNNFSSHRHVQGGVSSSGGNGGVSLTLGLRQNNGIGLSESFPMNIAQQYGLQASNEGYVIGSFETPNRHFGKDIGGQLFHDFVG